VVKYDFVGVFKYTCKHHRTHPTLIYKWNHVIFLIFNHKFTQSTKINALENNKSKPICNHENSLNVRLGKSEMWLKVN
jgi:hypothetical protein